MGNPESDSSGSVDQEHGVMAGREVVKSLEAVGGRAFTVRADTALPNAVAEFCSGPVQALSERSGKVETGILVVDSAITGARVDATGTAFSAQGRTDSSPNRHTSKGTKIHV
ncbi:hypothetical protein ABT040_32565 [Streptomyces sp. NPDC002688]|uniref:hypothetical protein n=1 Tax=Streptomyces sp. NPDC002688 TaxID=3154423 RepID=UPI0033315D9F